MKRDESSVVKELSVADEFKTPYLYKIKIFDLCKFGVPYVPAISHVTYGQMGIAAPWHVHKDCIEFLYCATGTCEYESEGKVFHLSPGMMFVSRPHEAHRQLECPKGHATFCMMFRPYRDNMTQFFSREFAARPRLFSCTGSVSTFFGRILTLAERGDKSLGSRFRMQMLVQSLLFDILDSASYLIRQKVPDVLDVISERMQKHPERDYPMETLVAESGFSKTSFIAMFKKAYGLPPRTYLLRCRIDTAKDLIRKGVAVKVVADRLGFFSAHHFARTFKSFTGNSPTKWAGT